MENEIMNNVEKQVMNEEVSTKGETAMITLLLIGTAALGHLVGEGVKSGYKYCKERLANRKKNKGVIEIDNTVEIEDIDEI